MEFTQEQKLYAEIVQKAWEDAQFKSELLADPAEAIEKLTGQKLNLPKGKTLVIRDQTDEETVYINIPAQPKNVADVELNENNWKLWREDLKVKLRDGLEVIVLQDQLFLAH